MKFLTEFQIAGNSLWRIGSFLAIILVSFAIGRILRFILLKAAQKARNLQRKYTHVILQSIARSIVLLTLSIGLNLGVSLLVLNDLARQILNPILDSLVVVAIAYMLYCMVEVVHVWFQEFAARSKSKLDDMLAPVVGKTLRIFIVILALLQIFQILSDKPLTSIIASLGIGGLAVALAAQDTLKNFFGSLVLITTRPFEVGDRVVLGEHDGPVEEVGLWATRIRTLDGHLVTVPNSQLTNAAIRNIGKRPYIRRVADIGITYDTPPEKVERALQILRELLDNHEGMNPDLPPRVFFADFGPSALILRVIYWYHPPDYWKFVTFSEQFNKEVFRRFNEEGIDFAFPTQTIYLAGDPKRPLHWGPPPQA